MAKMREDITVSVKVYSPFRYEHEKLQAYLKRRNGFSRAEVTDSVTMQGTVFTIRLGFTLTTDVGERIHNRCDRLVGHIDDLDKKTETALNLQRALDMLHKEDAK